MDTKLEHFYQICLIRLKLVQFEMDTKHGDDEACAFLCLKLVQFEMDTKPRFLGSPAPQSFEAGESLNGLLTVFMCVW